MRTQTFLSDEHLHAIGLVITEWAELEYFLHATIWAIANIENQGRGNAMTDHLRAQQLSSVLKSVALDRLGDSPEYDDIQIICKGIRRLYEERNKFAHAKWQLDSKDDMVYKANRRSHDRLVVTWAAVGVEEIERVAQEISDLIDQLERLFFQYRPDSWPDEPRKPSLQ